METHHYFIIQMATKQFILSASGLQNIPVENDNVFRFLFENKEIQLNRIHADFISPIASHLHRTDSTSNSYQFGNIFNKIPTIPTCDPNTIQYNKFDDVFDEKMLQIIKSISTGQRADINSIQFHKLRLISIIFGNSNMYDEVKETMKQNNFNNDDVDQYLQYLLYFHYFSKCYSPKISDKNIIHYIASHFYSIDKNKLAVLPKSTLLEIISDENLKIEDENSLFDFINLIFSNSKNINQELDGKDIDIVYFYEKIKFASLNEKKLSEFRQKFDFTKMTNELWHNYSKCNDRDVYSTKNLNEDHFKRYVYGNYQLFPFNEDKEKSLKGIINHLNNKCSGNSFEKSIIDIKLSSYGFGEIKNLVNFNEDSHYFFSKDIPNSWVQYDFKNIKVRPTHYTIRSSKEENKVDHPRNWVIQGSDTGLDGDWIDLDLRKDIECIEEPKSLHTFFIQTPLKQDEYYRFLRILQNGINAYNRHYLDFSCIEFFGSIISK